MKRGTLLAAAFTVLLGFAAVAAADEKADQAIKELDESFAKVNSYTCKAQMMTDTEFGPGQAYKSKMLITSEWVRKGQKALMRNQAKSKTEQTMDGKTTKTTSMTTGVSDGDFLYTMTEGSGKKTAIKSRAPVAQDYHPSVIFDQLREYNEIKLLPDEKVDGHDCYVFELKSKPMAGQPAGGRSVSHYAKANGIQLKSEAFDANGKLTSSSTTTDIKINVDISEDHFKFEVPADAEFIDATKLEQEQPQMESKPEESEEQPAEQEEPKKPEKEKKKKPKLPKLPKLP